MAASYAGLASEAVTIVEIHDGIARSFVVLPDGEAVSRAVFVAREGEAYRARFGKLTETMWQRYAEAQPDEQIKFTVLIDGEFLEPPTYNEDTDDAEGPSSDPSSAVAATSAEFEASVVTYREAQRTRLAELKAPVISAFIAAGASLEDELASLPMFRIEGSAALLESDWILDDPRIVRIHEADSDQPASLLGYAGHHSMNEAAFWGAGGCNTYGCTGQQIAVGLWEEENGIIGQWPGVASKNTRFNTNNVSYLHTPPLCTTDANCTSPLNNRTRCRTARVTGYPSTQKFCVQEHLTYVAGSIGMKGGYTYVAGEMGTGSGAITFGDGVGAWEEVLYVGNESDVAGLNYLLGTPTTHINRSQDQAIGDSADGINWAARYDDVLTTLSSGNTGSSFVVCGAVWNGLCVGAYRYETWSVGSTHRRYSNSGYLNSPLIPGLERPHLLGPGLHSEVDGLHLPSISADTSGAMVSHPIDGGEIGGTSFASPAVLAFAIGAHQYEGWFSNLTHPIVKKAVLMAGSRDSNNDGQIKNGDDWSSASDGEDGAGHPWGSWTKQILDSNQYKYRSLSAASFVSCGANCLEYTVSTATAPTNGRIKVALAWNACNTTQTGTALLANDLDLILVRPAGGSCGSSMRQSISAVSEVEMLYDTCLFGTGVGGTYEIRVRIKDGLALQACGADTTEEIGVAWSYQ